MPFHTTAGANHLLTTSQSAHANLSHPASSCVQIHRPSVQTPLGGVALVGVQNNSLCFKNTDPTGCIPRRMSVFHSYGRFSVQGGQYNQFLPPMYRFLRNSPEHRLCLWWEPTGGPRHASSPSWCVDARRNVPCRSHIEPAHCPAF